MQGETTKPVENTRWARGTARKAWRWVGEMEEILGTWQPHGSFEDEVFRRWTESSNPRTRRRRFEELAQHLVVARKLYQKQKDQQNWLFPAAKEKDAT